MAGHGLFSHGFCFLLGAKQRIKRNDERVEKLTIRISLLKNLFFHRIMKWTWAQFARITSFRGQQSENLFPIYGNRPIRLICEPKSRKKIPTMLLIYEDYPSPFVPHYAVLFPLFISFPKRLWWPSLFSLKGRHSSRHLWTTRSLQNKSQVFICGLKVVGWLVHCIELERPLRSNNTFVVPSETTEARSFNGAISCSCSRVENTNSGRGTSFQKSKSNLISTTSYLIWGSF